MNNDIEFFGEGLFYFGGRTIKTYLVIVDQFGKFKVALGFEVGIVSFEIIDSFRSVRRYGRTIIYKSRAFEIVYDSAANSVFVYYYILHSDFVLLCQFDYLAFYEVIGACSIDNVVDDFKAIPNEYNALVFSFPSDVGCDVFLSVVFWICSEGRYRIV